MLQKLTFPYFTLSLSKVNGNKTLRFANTVAQGCSLPLTLVNGDCCFSAKPKKKKRQRVQPIKLFLSTSFFSFSLNKRQLRYIIQVKLYLLRYINVVLRLNLIDKCYVLFLNYAL